MESPGDIRIRLWNESSRHASAEFRQVLALGKKFSSTLGFLPDSAFLDRARTKGLIVAMLDTVVVGYCLFGVNRAGRLKLLHVCVEKSGRSNGLGKRLVDTAVGVSPSATGILADCRRDYRLDGFWKSLGMHVASERPGRAKSGSILNRWWKSLGDPDLLEASATSSSLPLVVLDSNIVADLYGSKPRDDREASLGLLAGWLDASVVYAISTQVLIEIDAIEERAEREAQRGGSSGLLLLRTSRPHDRDIENNLTASIGEDVLSKDRSLQDDLKHLADAIRAGANYFVTNDTALLDAVGTWLEKDHSIVALRPHDLVREMQSVLDRPVYESRLLESVDLTWVRASQFSELDLELAFMTYPFEKPTHFSRALRASMANEPSTTTQVLVDANQKPLALISSAPRATGLAVSLLRAARGVRASTLALQLTRHIRRLAHNANLSSVVVRDGFLAPATEAALAFDGFIERVGEWRCETVTGLVLLSDFAQQYPNRPLTTPQEVALTERHFWPLVLADADLPTYLIPIQPRHAERLFGFSNAALFHSRRLGVGLSREHAYFHAGRSLPEGPARILWYVTGDDTDQVRQVAAYSRMVESVVLAPKDAHRDFGHLGVLRLRDIKGGARNDGMVHVLRFEDTELLDTPLGRDQLRPLFVKHAVNAPIQSTRKVSSALFDDILQSQVAN
jgi:hypothetical protein